MGACEVESEPRWRWAGLEALADERDEEHMAADAALLGTVEQGAYVGAARIYRWRAAAATIGRHQSEAAAQREFPALALYRRPTGGKAVRHGDDLTVALAVSTSALTLKASGTVKAYDALVEPLRAAYAHFGVETTRGRNISAAETGKDASENCFSAAARCDVLDRKHGIKIVGCALRRTARAVLLQMSLRPHTDVDIFSQAFTDELRRQYTRYLNSGCWNVVER